MYATQFGRNFQSNQHGLPGKISRLKIIASFTTKLCTAFTYNLLHHLRIRNCSNNVRKRCVLNVYWEVVYRTNGFIKRRSVTSVIPKGLANCHVTLSRTIPLSPKNGIGICWINESTWQSLPVCLSVCMLQIKFLFQVTNYKFQTKCQLNIHYNVI